jgi:hypothetical protein
VVPGPVRVNNGEIGINIVRNRVTNRDDMWSPVVYMAKFFFLLITPFFNCENNENKKMCFLIKLSQICLAIITFVIILIYNILVINNLINETKPYGREFWINQYILATSVAVLSMMFILWVRREDFRLLVLLDEVDPLPIVEIDVLSQITFALLRTLTLFVIVLVFHIAKRCTYNNNNFFTVYSFFVYIGYNDVFIIYIVLFWMMCARFRHLNSLVKTLTKKIITGQERIRADKHHLQQIANWYVDMFFLSTCIETMLVLMIYPAP